MVKKLKGKKGGRFKTVGANLLTGLPQISSAPSLSATPILSPACFISLLSSPSPICHRAACLLSDLLCALYGGCPRHLWFGHLWFKTLVK